MDGAASATGYERIAFSKDGRAGLSLVRCRLLTGRMHQIRVHLAAAGWPIVGDPKYGQPRWRDVSDPGTAARLRAFPRQALHAWRLRFVHPADRRPMHLEAPMPDDFRTLLDTTGLRLEA
jgi:23S rRNA pseudouridine1911/1915/1917 synthase